MHHFFSNIINAIINEAEKSGYLVIILQSNDSIELEKKQVDLLINKRVDGILIALSNETNYDEHIKQIIKRNIPFVMFDKTTKLAPCSKVIIDDQKAAFNAVQHLIDNGCKKIAHIRGALNPQIAIDRFIGYKKALEKNNILFDPKLIYACEKTSFQEGADFAAQIINEHPDIDGVFAITDLVAVGVLSHFNKVGIKIPEQVAVIGFSNWFVCEIVTPKLSTIDQPGHQIGLEAYNLLLEEINSRKFGTPFIPRTILLETSLIARESSLRQ